MRPIILANYKNATPKELRKGIGMGAKVLNPYKDPLKEKTQLVINWGTRPTVGALLALKGPYTMLNNPQSVGLAINKQKTFTALWHRGVPCIEWTVDYGQALAWLKEGRSVFGRHKLEGSEGDGIVLAKQDLFRKHEKLPEGFSACKVWTRNFPKDREVRIHVFRNQVIFYSEKRKVNQERFKADPAFDKTLEKPDHFVRNHHNGWIFAHENVTIHQVAAQVAIKAVKELGLDFGAVDLLIAGDKAVVCEVNTAPGLEGQSLIAYLKAFQRELKPKTFGTGDTAN